MRNSSDYPNQQPRDTLGDSEKVSPPLMPDPQTPRFRLETTESQASPEWARNMVQYGGLVGEKDARELLGAAEREEAKHRRDQALEMLIGGQANALYSVHTALSLVQRSEVTPELTERLDQLFFYAALTIERVAKLLGKKPPSALFSIKDLEDQR